MEEPVKRYMVFAYDMYYPGGGLGDLRGSFDSVEEAREFASQQRSEYIEIFDRQDGVQLPF